MLKHCGNKVLHLCAGDEAYGVGTVIKLYGTHMPESYFACMQEGPLYEWLMKNNNKVVLISGLAKFKAKGSFWTLTRLPGLLLEARTTALNLLAFCKQNSIAIIHTHWLPQQLVAGYLRKHGYAVVWHIHNNTSRTRLWGAGRTLNHLMARWGADAIIAISHYIAGNWRSAGIPTHVVYSAPESSKKDKTLRDCENASALRCVLFARLVHSKGIHIAVKSVLEALEKGSNIRLDILGGPLDNNPYVDWIIKDILRHTDSSKIQFLGYCPNVIDRLQDYDIGLQCRIDPEPFGLSTCEALLAGLPVLGSATGATTELIQNGINGFLYNAL